MMFQIIIMKEWLYIICIAAADFCGSFLEVIKCHILYMPGW